MVHTFCYTMFIQVKGAIYFILTPRIKGKIESLFDMKTGMKLKLIVIFSNS